MANIKNYLDNIKGALFGKDVRGSIHDGIDAINKEVESTTGRQEHLEETFDQLVINSGNSNAELVDARVGANGQSYKKVGDRLDNFDSQLETIALYVDNFPSIQEAFNNASNNSTIYFTKGKEYTINSKIDINKKVIIEGNNATIKTNFDTITTEVFNIVNDGVTIMNLNFVGSGTISVLSYKAFIKSTSAGTHVDNCNFENGMQGVHFSSSKCKNSVVRNSYANNCYGSGFIILGGYNCTIDNCNAVSCGDGAISLFNAQYCKTTNNTVYTSDQAITVDAGSFSCVVSNNVVIGDKDGSTAKSGYYGIDVKNNSHSNVISNNTVSGTVVGIACRYGDPGQQNNSSNNMIDGNTISEINGKGLTTTIQCGILVEGQYGCSVLNNNINRCNGVQILVKSGGNYNKNLIIKNNILNLHGVNFGSLPYLKVDKNAIKVTSFSNVLIENNLIQNAPETMTVYSIDINECSNFIINNNTIENITYRAIITSGNCNGKITNNIFNCSANKVMVMYLNSTGFIKVGGNNQFGNECGYFLLGNSNLNLYTDNNRFNSAQTDSITSAGTTRNLNNENLNSNGFKGGHMRYSNSLLQTYNGSEWIDV